MSRFQSERIRTKLASMLVMQDYSLATMVDNSAKHQHKKVLPVCSADSSANKTMLCLTLPMGCSLCYPNLSENEVKNENGHSISAST